MIDIVLIELSVNPLSLYSDSGVKEINELKLEAVNSPAVQWAVRNNCTVKTTIFNDPTLDVQRIVYYAKLNEIQQTEFALRF